MEFRILGPLEVVEGNRPLQLGGLRQRAVLAILLLHANQVVGSDRLIDEVWGEAPPETAVNTLQVYVSQLRKALGAEVLLTRAPGYLLHVETNEFDLRRFERLLDEAQAAEPALAAEKLRAALALWRGPALADFAYEAFAQTAIARLEELRLAALERRIDADLALGRHADVVGELEALAAEHPLSERLHGQLMLALYRSGRQAEALEVYQSARRALIDQLGIEPNPSLRELEQAILRQENSLDVAAPHAVPERSILVAVDDADQLDSLLQVAEQLARNPPRELILARLIGLGAQLGEAASLLHEQRKILLEHGVSARAAAFTSDQPGNDLVRLVTAQDVDLLLVQAPPDLLDEGVPPTELELVLQQAPCDVALLVARRAVPDLGRPVLVPFGGDEHDWAAVEVGAWIARAQGSSLQLLGMAGDPAGGRRDASRLLASASLAIQHALGVAAEPLLTEPGKEAIVRAADGAGLLVVGLSPRWRQDGLGPMRLALSRDARPPTLLVRKGLRPGGLAPPESLTRFTWSLGPASA